MEEVQEKKELPPFRANAKNIILNILKENLPEQKYSSFAKTIERSIYKSSTISAKKRNIATNNSNNQYINIYNELCFNICSNLDPKSHVQNNQLVYKIPDLEKEDLKLIAFMSPQEWFPENWSEILTEKELKDQAKTTVKKSTYLKCRKCGSRDINVETAQTRSADEGMTTFQTCMNCGNVKKS